jgi:nucleotide-binding universal stress UspA family protein
VILRAPLEKIRYEACIESFMFQRILVPLDGSAASGKILPWVKDYAGRSHARIDLLQVIPESEPASEYDHRQGCARDSALRYLHGVAARLWDHGIHTELYVRVGTPARTIVHLAHTLRADLVMLVSRGLATLRRGLLGSTTDWVLRLAPPAVLVVPAGLPPPAEPIRLPTILVPLDGTPLSESVIPEAAGLALWHESRVILTGRPQTRLNELCRWLQQRGVPADVGETADEASLIAVHAPAPSIFPRFLRRHRIEALVRESAIPVFVSFHREPVEFGEWVGTGLAEAASV